MKQSWFYHTSCLTKGALICTLCILYAPAALANPQDGVVKAGTATISASGKKLDIHQTSKKAVIDWRSFDIAPDEHTAFHQPSSSAITLNRVNTNSPSQIHGKLSSNGNLVILNNSGIMFGAGAQVDVNGLVATTSGIDTQKFMKNGALHFNKPGKTDASITNDGRITAKDAGLVGLVAPNVVNNGTITAKLGRVQLASADSFVMDMYGDGLLSFKVSDDVKKQIVTNKGVIDASGGVIGITAAAGRNVVDSLITVSGELKAPSIGTKNGKIVIFAEGKNAVANNIASNKGKKLYTSTALVDAKIDVSGRGLDEKAGSVDILADNVVLKSGAKIDAAGNKGGGIVHVGGEYYGGGKTPTALTTFVEKDVDINADALLSGKGGNVTIWADKDTSFYGAITARGGSMSGDGGFVEVSGKQFLKYKGFVDTRAENGETGLLLLDPADIVIANGTGDGAADGTGTFQGGATPGTIASGDAGPTTIYESELEGIAATTSIAIAATNSIIINNLSTDGVLNLAQTAGHTVSFTAGTGGITMANTANTIRTDGGALTFTTSGAGGVTLGDVNTHGGLLTLDVGGTSSIAGVVAGTGGLTKTGAGTLTMSGNNTYSGTTTLTNGVLSVGHNNALGTGTLHFDGGTLIGNGSSRTLLNNMTSTAAINIGGTSDLTFKGTLDGYNTNRTLTLTNSGLTTFDGNISISSAGTNRGITITGTGNSVFNGVISNRADGGLGNITLTSTGTTTFNNANTYAGITQLNAGTLIAGNNAAFGTSLLRLSSSDGITGILQGNGSPLTLANNIELFYGLIGGASNITLNGNIASYNANRTLTVSNTGMTTFNGDIAISDSGQKTLTVNGNGNVTINGVISDGTGTGSLTKAGGGTLALNGANTYSGLTTIFAGTVQAGNNAAFGTGGLFFSIAGTGKLSGASSPLTLANAISGVLRVSGSSDVTFNGAVSGYSASRTFEFDNTGVTTFNGDITIASTSAGNRLTFSHSGDVVINGALHNGGTATDSSIGKSGNGTLTLNGASTYGGGSRLDSGIVIAGNDAAFGTSVIRLGAANLQSNGTPRTFSNTLSLIGSGTLGGTADMVFNGNVYSIGDRILTVSNGLTTFNGNVFLSDTSTPHTLTFQGTGNAIVNGVISDGNTATAGEILKYGSGTLTLNGANTYSGFTRIYEGTIAAGNNSAFGTSEMRFSVAPGNNGRITGTGSPLTISNTLGSTVRVGGSSDITFTGNVLGYSGNRIFFIDNTGLTTFNGNIALADSATSRTLTFEGDGNVTVNGIISNGSTSNAGEILKYGNGTLTLNGNNTYGGATRIYTGTVAAGNNNAFGTSEIRFSTAFGNTGNIVGTGSPLTFSNALGGAIRVGGSSDITFNGNVAGNADNRTFVIDNSGLTTFNGNIALSDSSTSRNLTFEGDGNVTVNGVISNGSTSTAGEVLKYGNGTLTLNGANTYGGKTTLAEGILAAGSNTALGTGTIFFTDGTLTGTGSPITLANQLDNTLRIGGSSDITFNGNVSGLTSSRTFVIDNTGLTTFNGDIDISSYHLGRRLSIAANGDVIINGIIKNGGTATDSELAKSGSGTLTLNGANTYGGPTLVNGTIIVGNDSALGTGLLRLSSGTLRGDGTPRTLANDITLVNNASISGASDITFNGNMSLDSSRTLNISNTGLTTFNGNISLSETSSSSTLTIDGAGDVVVNGVISNGASSASSLVKASTSINKLTLNGANTYSGATTLNGGTTVIGNNAAFGTGLLVLNGGGLDVGSSARTIANAIDLSADTIIDGNADLTLNGALSNGGNLRLDINNAGLTTFNGDVELTRGAGTGRYLQINGAGNITFNGVIKENVGVGSIRKGGSGILTLNNANTYTGQTRIYSPATLVIGHNQALGTSTLQLAGGTVQGDGTARALGNTIEFLSSSSIGGLSDITFNGTFNNGGNRTLTVNNAGLTTFNGMVNISDSATSYLMTIGGTGDVVFNGVIANGGTSTASSLRKEDSGAITLNGANTYAGGMTIAGSGKTVIGNNAAFGTGELALRSGAVLEGTGSQKTISNHLSTNGDFTVQGSTALAFTGKLTNTNNGDIAITINNAGTTIFHDIDLSNSAVSRNLILLGSGDVVIDGIIANGGSATASGIVKSNTASLRLLGANTYSGTTSLTAGKLIIGHNQAIGSGTLEVSGNSALQGSGSSGSYTLANDIKLAGNLGIVGLTNLTFNGDLTLTGGNRNLTFNNTGTTIFNGDVNLSDNATGNRLILLGDYSATFNGVISNGTAAVGSVYKSNLGTVTFNGANTYTGNTVLTDGITVVGNNNAFGTSTLTLGGSNVTLRASGPARTLANIVNINNDATISGSTDLTFNGKMTNTSGQDFMLTINNSGVTTFRDIDLSNDTTSHTMTLAGSGGRVNLYGIIADGGGSAGGNIVYNMPNRQIGISGNNTYSGLTTLNDGSLVLGHNNALGTSTLLVTGATARMRVGNGAGVTLANDVVLAGNLDIYGSNDFTLNGLLTQSGDRTLTISNSGLTTLGNIDLSNNATSYTLTLAGTGDTYINGIIANGGTAASGSVVYDNTGVITLGNVNTYAGQTLVNAGTLKYGHDNATSSTSAIIVDASATFDLNGYNAHAASIVNDGQMIFGGGNRIETTGGQTYNGRVTSSGPIEMVSTGNGDVIADNTLNNFIGDVSISTGGDARVTDANSLSFGDVTANTIFANARAGSLTLNGDIEATGNSGPSITLLANNGFMNNSGANALTTHGSAYWLVYSSDPADGDTGGLTGFEQYDTHYGDMITGSGNGFIYAASEVISMESMPSTVAWASQNSLNSTGSDVNESEDKDNPAEQNSSSSVRKKINDLLYIHPLLAKLFKI